MDFSIFDLYATACKLGSKPRKHFAGALAHVEKRESESPDSMQWEDSNDSTKHPIPYIPADNRIERVESSTDCTSDFFYKPPPLLGGPRETEETLRKLPNVPRMSLYGPVRNWPLNMRASRCFVPAHGYQDNLKLLEHFHQRGGSKYCKPSGLEDSRKGLNQSLSHPKLAPVKAKQIHKSMPLENSASNKTINRDEGKKRLNALHRRQYSLAILDKQNSSTTLAHSSESTPVDVTIGSGSFEQVSRKSGPLLPIKHCKALLPCPIKKPAFRRSL